MTSSPRVSGFGPPVPALPPRRPRRKFEEVERLYECNWNGCIKAYGTLSHLNDHVRLQNHGEKRKPSEFKDIRKKRRDHISRLSPDSQSHSTGSPPPNSVTNGHHSDSNGSPSPSASPSIPLPADIMPLSHSRRSHSPPPRPSLSMYGPSSSAPLSSSHAISDTRSSSNAAAAPATSTPTSPRAVPRPPFYPPDRRSRSASPGPRYSRYDPGADSDEAEEDDEEPPQRPSLIWQPSNHLSGVLKQYEPRALPPAPSARPSSSRHPNAAALSVYSDSSSLQRNRGSMSIPIRPNGSTAHLSRQQQQLLLQRQMEEQHYQHQQQLRRWREQQQRYPPSRQLDADFGSVLLPHSARGPGGSSSTGQRIDSISRPSASRYSSSSSAGSTSMLPPNYSSHARPSPRSQSISIPLQQGKPASQQSPIATHPLAHRNPRPPQPHPHQSHTTPSPASVPQTPRSPQQHISFHSRPQQQSQSQSSSSTVPPPNNGTGSSSAKSPSSAALSQPLPPCSTLLTAVDAPVSPPLAGAPRPGMFRSPSSSPIALPRRPSVVEPSGDDGDAAGHVRNHTYTVQGADGAASPSTTAVKSPPSAAAPLAKPGSVASPQPAVIQLSPRVDVSHRGNSSVGKVVYDVDAEGDVDMLRHPPVSSLPASLSLTLGYPSGHHKPITVALGLAGSHEAQETRPFTCSWPDCDKRYNTLKHLNEHVQLQRHGAKRSRSEFMDTHDLPPSTKRQRRVDLVVPPVPVLPGSSASLEMRPHSVSPSVSAELAAKSQAVLREKKGRVSTKERAYACSWAGCTKAYTKLDHLNVHVKAQGHGGKRTPLEFRHLRKVCRVSRLDYERMEAGGMVGLDSLDDSAARRAAKNAEADDSADHKVEVESEDEDDDLAQEAEKSMSLESKDDESMAKHEDDDAQMEADDQKEVDTSNIDAGHESDDRSEIESEDSDEEMELQREKKSPPSLTLLTKPPSSSSFSAAGPPRPFPPPPADMKTSSSASSSATLFNTSISGTTSPPISLRSASLSHSSGTPSPAFQLNSLSGGSYHSAVLQQRLNTPNTRARSSSDPANSSILSFTGTPTVQKRARRAYDEIERFYSCNWEGCDKAYGSLNHLNAHVSLQRHGRKREPEEFKELRKMLKERRAATAATAAVNPAPTTTTAKSALFTTVPRQLNLRQRSTTYNPRGLTASDNANDLLDDEGFLIDSRSNNSPPPRSSYPRSTAIDA